MNLPATEAIVCRREQWCLHVTLNRPEVRNAFNVQMWRELEAVFDAIADDRGIRAVVLRGAGGNLSVGGDLKERSTIEARPGEDPLVARNRSGGAIFSKIDRAPQTVIVVVEGYALGGGLGLTCVADVAIAAHDAVFRLPEATLGIPVAQIVPFITRRVGASQARRLALTAATISGAEALPLGLVHFACADAEALEAQLRSVLQQIDRCAPGATAEAKRLIRAVGTTDDDRLLDEAARTFARAYRGDEGAEGTAAFREKRPPAWNAGAFR